MSSIKYRKDIDGLRAIAVLLVLFYHAGLPVQGGFIGVDVFFVISGFLITTIINKEIKDGLFTFSSFYARRIKRLIPALFFMIVVVCTYCSYFLLPSDLLSLSKTAIYSLVGVSNFYFYSHTNYFESATSEPLLHTWSLAVEEQFYLFWPFILIFLFSYSKKRKIIILSVIFFLSLLLSQYYTIQNKNLAYMMLPFRFFELMIGALASINYYLISDKIKNHANKMSSLGLTLIIGSAFFLNESSQFPGLLALPVTIGTALILLFPENKSGVINNILSFRPITYIGRISYSLYLWHWPLIALAKYKGYDITTLNATLIIGLSFLISVFSFHFIEIPARNIKNKKIIFSCLYIIPIIIILVFLLIIISTKGLKFRTDAKLPELDPQNAAHEIRFECMEKMNVGNIDTCWLGMKKSKPDVLMIGDSFGNAYTGFIDVLAKDANIMVHDTMKSSTPSIPNVFVSSVNNKLSNNEAKKTIMYNNERTNYSLSVKAVIISDYFDQYNDNNKSYRMYDKNWNDVSKYAFNYREKYIKNLIDNGVKVFIIARPFSGIGRDNLSKLRSKKWNDEDIDNITYPYGIDKEEREEYRLKKRFPSIVIIDPNDVLCSNEKCRATIHGDIIFRDDGAHLNNSSSIKLGQEYLKNHKNPFTGL